MRKVLLTTVAIVAVSFGSLLAMSPSKSAEPSVEVGVGKGVSIGVLDLNRVNQDAKVMKNLAAQRDKELDKIKVELEKKKTEFEKREGDLRAKQVVMSQEAFARDVAQFQKEVREAEVALQRKGEAVERAFMEALRKLQNDHMDKIYKEIGSKRGFDMLLTNQSAFLLNSKLDVTDEIIKALDGRVKEMKLEVK